MVVLPALGIVAANGNLALNDPGTSAVGRWIIDAALTIGTGTIKVQKRLKVDPSVTAHAFADCWYTLALSNTEVAAGTTQSASCIIDVDASACDVQIVLTVGGGGIWEIFATPLTG
jgi:hypothetical protein